jgi:3-oxoacyl-[acyl-carrier protein] reductase
MNLGLDGKVALVAASSKGLGRACALELAREGASVVVSSRDADRLDRIAGEIRAETGSEVHAVTADVSSSEDIDALIAATRERFGPIDVMVMNSGAPRGGRLPDLSDEDWLEGFELVTLSLVRVLRLVLPSMVERGWGRFISIQSTSVKQPIPHLVLSNGLRPGAQGVLKSVVEGAAAHGVTVNTVLPGMFLTDRLVDDLRATAERSGTTLEEEQQRAGTYNPTGRVGDPAELAAAVAFLASSRASFINGATLQVDGGAIRSLA